MAFVTKNNNHKNLVSRKGGIRRKEENMKWSGYSDVKLKKEGHYVSLWQKPRRIQGEHRSAPRSVSSFHVTPPSLPETLLLLYLEPLFTLAGLGSCWRLGLRDALNLSDATRYFTPTLLSPHSLLLLLLVLWYNWDPPCFRLILHP